MITKKKFTLLLHAKMRNKHVRWFRSLGRTCQLSRKCGTYCVVVTRDFFPWDQCLLWYYLRLQNLTLRSENVPRSFWNSPLMFPKYCSGPMKTMVNCGIPCGVRTVIPGRAKRLIPPPINGTGFAYGRSSFTYLCSIFSWWVRLEEVMPESAHNLG